MFIAHSRGQSLTALSSVYKCTGVFQVGPKKGGKGTEKNLPVKDRDCAEERTRRELGVYERWI